MTHGGRLAIIGDGPLAVYALRSLLRAADAQVGELPQRIDVVAPSGRIGPGQVFAVHQPPWLRCQVDATHVDAWAGGEPTGEDPLELSFHDWLQQVRPRATTDRFPPRSLLGRYLCEVGVELRSRLGTDRVHIVRGLASRVARLDGGWSVAVEPTADPGAAVGPASGVVGSHRSVTTYDHVLLATGQASDWSGALRHSWDQEMGPRLHPRVHPVTDLIETVRTTAPRTVVVRGAGTVGIDAVLALSEGLGGVFTRRPGSPWRLTYAPVRLQPHIVLAGGTGRLMQVQTAPEVLADIPAVGWIIDEHAPRLEDEDANVGQVVVDTAVALLQTVHHDPQLDPAHEVIRAVTEMLGGSPPQDPLGWLTRSLQMAHGEAPLDAWWALGHAWLGLYPGLMRRQESVVDDASGHPLGWPDYHRWSAELDRLAFGPSPADGARLHALTESGHLGVRLGGDVRAVAEEVEADLVVDAALAPPGIRDTSSVPWTGLVADGVVVAGERSRGVLVDTDLTCVDADGRRREGLAAVGPATEDVILGSHTLARTMRPCPYLDRWAHGVLTRS